MNNYELHEHKQSDSIKWVAAFTLIALLFVGVLASLIMSISSVLEEDVKDPEAEASQAEDVSHLIAGNFDGSGMTLSLASDTAAVTDTPDTVTVTATMDAEFGVYDNTITWQLSFEKHNSVWASGKSPKDYVEMIVSEDTHSVTLVAKEPFSEPIIIYAFSNESPMCDATCRLDYMKRIKQGTGISTNVYGEDDKKYENYIRMGMDTLLAVQFELTEGTMNPDIFMTEVELMPSEEFKTLMRNNIADDGCEVLDSIKLSVSPWAYSLTSAATKFTIDINSLCSGDGDLRQLNNAIYRNAYNALSGEGSDFMTFTAKVKISVQYPETVYQVFEYSSPINLKVERGNLEYNPAVTDLTLDTEGIIF